jgi:excisionase family DNA binding protein
MPTKPDYSTWLTKQQAAQAIEASTKTIEQLARDGKLQQQRWRRPEGGPQIVVYHPRDVERLRKERNPDAAPFVLPTASTGSVNQELVPVRGPEQFMQALAAMTSQTSEKRSTTVRLSEKLYLTFSEAAEYTGLGVGYLRELVMRGELLPRKRIGPHGSSVLRREELEKL